VASVPDSSVLSQVVSSAGAGTALIVVLILTGILNTSRYTDRVEAETKRWKQAYDAERQLTTASAAAIAAAAARADAAVEVAALTKELLEDLRRRTDAIPERTPP
jgi:hypothetical protein